MGESTALPRRNRHAIEDATACREALARLPELDLGGVRQQWRTLYKAEASPHLSRELLVRAVAHRMQELALGGLRPEPRRQLLRIAQQFKETGQAPVRARPELKPGTRLMREWQGRTYDVLVLDDGFSWQGTSYRSLSACRRKIEMSPGVQSRDDTRVPDGHEGERLGLHLGRGVEQRI